jgi:hypothetical protein
LIPFVNWTGLYKRAYADTTTLQHDIASLQSPFQDRPLALLPRWFDFNAMTGSNFDSPYYDRIQTPLVRQYNLGLQWEFVKSYVFETGYVGSSGINIADYSHVVNTARLASPSAPVNSQTGNTTQCLQPRAICHSDRRGEHQQPEPVQQ